MKGPENWFDNPDRSGNATLFWRGIVTDSGFHLIKSCFVLFQIIEKFLRVLFLIMISTVFNWALCDWNLYFNCEFVGNIQKYPINFNRNFD
jgi:hypothetical protein